MAPEEKNALMTEVNSYLNESCESVLNNLEFNIENRINSFPQFYGDIPDNFMRACVLSAKESYIASIKSFEEALKHALENQ